MSSCYSCCTNDIAYDLVNPIIAKAETPDVVLTHFERPGNTPEPKLQCGIIEFNGTDRVHLNTESKYITVDPGEDVDDIIMAMKQEWNLHLPKLLICMLGGDTLTPAYETIDKSFWQGLVEAILRTDVWLFTDGVNCGMIKTVGEALITYAIGRAMVKNRDIVAVGVAPLGALKQKDKFLAHEGEKRVMYDIPSNGDVECNHGEGTPTYHLEPNHTHFILVGDQNSEPGDEASLRTKLVNKIASSQIKGSKAKVPVLYLVFGGDAASIQTVYDAVMEQKIPVLIIPDSGGAADVLSWAINWKQKNPKKIDLSGLDIKITEALQLDPDDRNRIKIQIRKIINPKQRHLLNNYKEGVGIEEAILEALMKANSGGGKHHDNLLFAVMWDQIDLAQAQLRNYQDWKDDELKDSLEYALVNNQHKFVKLFLDEGKIDLKKFLSVKMLTDLYGQNSKVCGPFTLKEDVSNLLKKLIFDTYEPMYDSDAIYDSEDKTCCKPFRDLFLWAVLYHRFELASLFWKRGNPSIGGALVGSNLLRAMSKDALDLQESAKMANHAKEFQKMAIELLNHCYTEDRSRTSLLLVRELPDWGNSTCLDLAVAAYCKQFIAHAAVQDLLNELWMGQLSPYTGQFKICSCICFPFAIPFALTSMSRDDPSVPANQMVAEGAITREDIKSSKAGKNCKESLVRYFPANDKRCDSVRIRMTPMQHGSNRGKSLPWWEKFKLFFEAPVISFRLNTISHVLFLGLFSYILLTNFHEKISILEMVLIGWVFTLFTEEMRQILQEDFHTLCHRFKAWVWGYWNFIDLVSLVMFAIGVGLRFHPGTLDAARIVLALDLIVFYLRILHIFSASEILGPKLIMIFKMMKDLVSFLAIFLVFMIAYGVANQSILFPNTRDPVNIVKGVLYQSYFHLYGIFVRDELNYEDCAAGNATLTGDVRCTDHSWYATVALALYLFISNVLLLNLLIAMLNYTFQVIQENTDALWKFQRYHLVKEYYFRPPFMPPFIIVIHLYQVIRWAWDKRFPDCKMYRSPNLMKRKLDGQKLIKISIWEEVKGEDYLAEKKQAADNKMMSRMNEKQQNLSSTLNKNPSIRNKASFRRHDLYLKKEFKQINKALLNLTMLRQTAEDKGAQSKKRQAAPPAESHYKKGKPQRLPLTHRRLHGHRGKRCSSTSATSQTANVRRPEVGSTSEEENVA